MAQATSSPFKDFILRVETDTPGTYAPICGLTSRGVTGSADVSTVEVPDCADEGLPAWQEKDVKSIGASVKGAGMWTAESHDMLWDWFFSAAPKNCQLEWAKAPTGAQYRWQGPMVLTNIDNSVARGERLAADISLDFTQKPTITVKA